MYELIPIGAGVALGGFLLSMAPGWTRVFVGAVSGVAVGVAAAAISGELGDSLAFALWDASQCGAVAAMVTAAPLLARRRV